jgi:putative ABC transport system substrate-binding protein
MKRREFIISLGGAAASSITTSHAQQGRRLPHVVLWVGTDPASVPGRERADAFRDGMRRLGWSDGSTVQIDVRPAPATAEANRAAAVEAIASRPDVIVTAGAPILAAVHRETKSIPVVFTLVTDPVRDGFVVSLAQPGGNITGFTIWEHSFAGKWLEMLKEVVPSISHVAVMQNLDHPAWNAYFGAIRSIGSNIGVQVTPTPIKNAGDVEAGLARFDRHSNAGLILLPSPVSTQHREIIAAAALRHGLPSIYANRDYPASGGFMSYGIVNADIFRQSAAYVDRILKGAKPGDLPVQAATKFEMVFNLKTAKALGIAVPATMLGRADEVIE